jgi:ketosteroid isomerase-like protein
MRLYAVAVVLLCLTSRALAQAPAPKTVPPPPSPGVSTAQLHDELRRMRDEILAAISRGDVDAILKHLHPNVVFTPMNNEVCRGPVQVRDFFEKMMKGPDHVVETVRLDLKVDALTDLYGDTGVAFGSSEDHYKLTNGLSFTVKTRWTCSLVRQDGRWLITSFQAGANLFDNPFLAGAKRRAWWAGILAGIAFLAIGFLLGRRWKKAAL